jgi:hypothetical protein
MATRSQVQFNYGTATEVAAYTGVAREVIVDSTAQRLILTDGVTAGGKAIAMEAYVLAQIAALTAGLSQNITLSRRCI